jgi:hypothetical protein
MLTVPYLIKLISVLVFALFWGLPSFELFAQELPPPPIEDSSESDENSGNEATDSTESDDSEEIADDEEYEEEDTVIMDEIGDDIRPEDFQDNPDLPFTGTLHPDDPDNEGWKQRESFFSDENPHAQSTDQAYDTEASFTGILRFYDLKRLRDEMISQQKMTATDKDVDPQILLDVLPDIEITYNLSWTHKGVWTKRRIQSLEDWKVTTNVEGSFLNHPEINCQIEVEDFEIPVDVDLRFKHKSMPNSEEASTQLGLKFQVPKKPETWHSLCRDQKSWELHTLGDMSYFIDILKRIQPGLSGYMLDDADPQETNTVEWESPAKVTTDLDLGYWVWTHGTGKITVDPE